MTIDGHAVAESAPTWIRHDRQDFLNMLNAGVVSLDNFRCVIDSTKHGFDYYQGLQDEAETLRNRVQKLGTENARLRAALQEIVDIENTNHAKFIGFAAFMFYAIKIARQALEEKP